MAPETAAGDDIFMRRRKIRYRAWHRGTREMDLILGPYADATLDGMDAIALDRFETLLDEIDTELFDWFTGLAQPPADTDVALIDDIRRFRQAQSAQQ